jgi:hypothetical protein
MSFAISTCPAHGESGWIAQVEKLSPCPQCKVLTVSLFAHLKLLGRLPVVLFSKLLLVGHIFTSRKETSKFWKVRAPVF